MAYTIVRDICTACGDCVDVCPRDLFELIPLSHHIFVQCKSPLAGDLALGLCTVACDACGRCASGLSRSGAARPRRARAPAPPAAIRKARQY